MPQLALKPPRRSQAERSATTSAALIDAAIQCFFELGYAATSTSIVAKKAGVSRGAMLHHFPTKVALVSSVVQETYARDIAAYTEALTNISSDGNSLHKLIDTAWQCFKSAGGVAQTEIWMAARSDAELGSEIFPLHQIIATRSQRALGYVLEQYDQKDFPDRDALLCYLVSALRGLSIQHILGSSERELDGGLALIKASVSGFIVKAEPSRIAQSA
jgi:AcrR family transcriptional regulator